MNPFLALLSLLAGAVITWLLVVRKVTVEVPYLRPPQDPADASETGLAAASAVTPAAHPEPASDASDDDEDDAGEPTDYVGEATAYAHAPLATMGGATRAAPRATGPMPAPEDGSAPAGYTVKGDTVARLYLLPTDRDFGRARPDIWFLDETAARDAGYTHFDRTPAGPGPA